MTVPFSDNPCSGDGACFHQTRSSFDLKFDGDFLGVNTVTLTPIVKCQDTTLNDFEKTSFSINVVNQLQTRRNLQDCSSQSIMTISKSSGSTTTFERESVDTTIGNNIQTLGYTATPRNYQVEFTITGVDEVSQNLITNGQVTHSTQNSIYSYTYGYYYNYFYLNLEINNPEFDDGLNNLNLQYNITASLTQTSCSEYLNVNGHLIVDLTVEQSCISSAFNTTNFEPTFEGRNRDFNQDTGLYV